MPDLSDLIARVEAARGNTSLFTHHHYGWRRHDLPNHHQDHLVAALLATHSFLSNFAGRYRVDIQRTPACSYDGRVCIYWADGTSKSMPLSPPLRHGDFWFEAFIFNQASERACRYCGGTGIDHYSGPFFHCWACDGSGVQIRSVRPRDQQLRPVDRFAAILKARQASNTAQQEEPRNDG